MVVVAGLLSACSSTGGDSALAAAGGGSSLPTRTPTLAPSPTPAGHVKPPKPPAKPPPTSGKASPSCVHGWTTPPVNSPLYEEPLRLISRTEGIHGPLVVTDMRYFIGGESPPPSPPKGYLAVIKRWYVKAYAKRDPAFQGRFLVESRVFGSGLSAVAPYDTKGFISPDWKGFQYDSANPDPRPVAGLPGTWSGSEYDFVKGGAGLTFPGLPVTVSGCLDGS